MSSVLDIGIASAEEPIQAIGVITKAGIDLAENKPELGLAEPPKVLGIGATEAGRTVIKVVVKVDVATKLFAAQMAARGLILERLTESGIYVA
jgi:hypothetical protein